MWPSVSCQDISRDRDWDASGRVHLVKDGLVLSVFHAKGGQDMANEKPGLTVFTDLHKS